MIYFKVKDFDVVKFSQNLKLSNKKQNQIQREYEKNPQKFIKKINDEEIIDFDKLMELVVSVKGRK